MDSQHDFLFCYTLGTDRCVTLKSLLKPVLFFCSFRPGSLKKPHDLPLTVHDLEWSGNVLTLGPAQLPVCSGVQMQTGLLNLPELFIEMRVTIGVSHTGLGP